MQSAMQWIRNTKTQWRVICPVCSKWFVADTARISYEMFDAHRQLKHWTLSTSVKPVQFQVNLPFLTFVVKGPENTAREQMFVRGIIGKTIGFTRTETVFKCGVEHRDAITAWFCENPEMLQGYGYPDGTCLIYSTHEVQS